MDNVQKQTNKQTKQKQKQQQKNNNNNNKKPQYSLYAIESIQNEEHITSPNMPP